MVRREPDPGDDHPTLLQSLPEIPPGPRHPAAPAAARAPAGRPVPDRAGAVPRVRRLARDRARGAARPRERRLALAPAGAGDLRPAPPGAAARPAPHRA